MPKECPVEELQPGMFVARPILDDQGRTIVQADSRLTPATIKRLQKWGIESVFLHESDPTPAEEDSKGDPGKELLQSATDKDRDFMRRVALAAQERFANVDGNSVMMELKRLAVRHIILSGRGAIPGCK